MTASPAKTRSGQRLMLVTCGPAYEPIDEVRRITNASTGELGVFLADALNAAGHRVICFKGEGATHPGPSLDVELAPFTTNQSLLDQLQPWAGDAVTAVFHAAALCDYRVKRASDASMNPLSQAKIPTRAGGITLELEPAPKVIASLRKWFPKALIVGWKYELDGDRANALAKGWQQMEEHQTDACVVNGRAYGEGFGICLPPDRVETVADKRALAQRLAKWVAAQAASAR